MLSPVYEARFCDQSFGFRPGRNGIQAILCGQRWIEAGFPWIIDLDIESFFDTVNHMLLTAMLKEEIHEEALLHLLEGYIHPRVIYGRHIYKKYRGLAQGSPISPLLSNIYLDRFDRYLLQQDYPFVRYADDVLIFFPTREEAEKAFPKLQQFLNEKLKLSVNREKSRICLFSEVTFLGYQYRIEVSGKVVLAIPESARKHMSDRMSYYLSGPGKDPGKYWRRIGAFNRGWINYYRYADPETTGPFLEDMDDLQAEWIYRTLQEQPDQGRQIRRSFFQTNDYCSLMQWYRRL